MITRNSYIEQLKAFIDKPQVKILIGIRRSGKSSVLLMLRDELISRGVPERQILLVKFNYLTNFTKIKSFELNLY